MPRQIGWSQESNLLYNISMQLDRLAAVTAAAGGGGGTITGGGAAGQITFWDAATNITGSNNLFWDNVNKRMGIGTNTPLTTAANYTVLALNNITGGVLEFQSNGTRIATINNNSLQLDIETKIAGPITFGTNGSERMRVDSVGNVGIGSNAPAVKLHVVGTEELIRLDASSGANNAYINFNARGFIGFNASSGLDIITGTTRPIRIGHGSWGSVTPYMTIFQNTGNVGINTSIDPGVRFGVTGNSLFSGDVSITGKLALTVVTNRQTVNYSLVLADNGKLVEMNVGAANTITVPPNSSIAFPIGTKIDIAQYGAGQTSIVPGVGVTVRSALGALKLAAQYSGASLVKIGTDEWYLFGDITV